ncbi:unnamed protein product, partial [Allacma fusca]
MDDVRSLTTLGKKRSVAEVADDGAAEAQTPGKRYGLRKRSVKSYDENFDVSHSPSPANTKKQKKSASPKEIPKAKDLGRRNYVRKQTTENSDESNCPSQDKKSKETV